MHLPPFFFFVFLLFSFQFLGFTKRVNDLVGLFIVGAESL